MPLNPNSADFVSLWSRHSKEIYAYIYSLVFNAADADDVFQETSIVLLEKFAEFEQGTNFVGWACKVARCKVLQAASNRKLPELLDTQILDAFESAAPKMATELDARIAALSNCLEKLTDRDRKLIRMRFEQDRSVESVAKSVGRSSSLVYKSLSRVYATLLECIRRQLAEGERS
jgi:RNA polymerase sigma-70 factor (ECF subfamily)